MPNFFFRNNFIFYVKILCYYVFSFKNDVQPNVNAIDAIRNYLPGLAKEVYYVLSNLSFVDISIASIIV